MVTNERFKRLAATVLLLAGLRAAGPAARGGDWMPMLPNQDFYDFQLFAPPDLQEYEIYPEASEGIFFNYDRLYWGITPPRVTGVGRTQVGNYIIPSQPISPQTIVQLNNASIAASGTGANVIGGLYTFGADPLQLDLNTSWLRTKMTWGNRYEGGWIYDNRGVEISYWNLGKQSQDFQTISEFAAASPTQIFTQSNTAGGGVGGGGVGNVNQALVTTTITSVSPPPDHIISQKLVQQTTTQIQSVGVGAIIRRELGKRGSGSTVRFGLGPRFLQFADRFNLGYESNQYAFNRGFGGAAGGAGGGAGGAAGGGAAGGVGGGAAGGVGGAAGGVGGVGGAAGGVGGVGGVGGGNIGTGVISTSAGDVLGITGDDTLTGRGVSTPMQTGAWETFTSNNMIGPEFSLLFETNRGRWTWSSELRFIAGMNFQNNIYHGTNFPNSIGADYLRATFTPSVTNTAGGGTSSAANTIQLAPPPLFLQLFGIGQANAYNDAEHRFVFSPIGEWRFAGEFRVSEAIRLKAGYTGMWLGSIARATTNTGYRTDSKLVQYAAQNTSTQPIRDPLNPDGAQVQPGYWYVAEKPVQFNRIGPVSGGTEYVFTNGVDIGLEIRY